MLKKSFLKPNPRTNAPVPHTSSTSANTSLENLKNVLKHTKDWKAVAELFESDEFVLPKKFS